MSHRRIAMLLFVALMAVYKANGREIGSVDTRPSKLAARALALRGNLWDWRDPQILRTWQNGRSPLNFDPFRREP